jgi:hypothetical protein
MPKAKRASRSAVAQPKGNIKIERGPNRTEKEELSDVQRQMVDLFVTDDSMAPYYVKGDKIQCDENPPRKGRCAVVRVKDGRRFVGRYDQGPSEKSDIVLSFENRETMTIPAEKVEYVASVDVMIRDETQE